MIEPGGEIVVYRGDDGRSQVQLRAVHGTAWLSQTQVAELYGTAGTDYFDELLERIRDIRASEKRFYQKVRAIFAITSADYDKGSETARTFFAIIQNKLVSRSHATRPPSSWRHGVTRTRRTWVSRRGRGSGFARRTSPWRRTISASRSSPI